MPVSAAALLAAMRNKTAPKVAPHGPPTVGGNKPQPTAPSAKKAAAKRPTAAAAPAPARTTPPVTGIYADAFNSIDDLERTNRAMEDRRLSDNLLYNKWVAAQQDKVGVDLSARADEAARRQTAVITLTQQAAQQREGAAAAERMARQGGVTDGAAGTSRDMVNAGNDQTQSLLQAAQQRTGADQLGAAYMLPFLASANAATGAANAARIRGEAAGERGDLQKSRIDLSVRRDDAISEQQAAAAAAMADIAEANLADEDRDADRALRASIADKSAGIAGDRLRNDMTKARLASNDKRKARLLSARNNVRSTSGRGSGKAASDLKKQYDKYENDLSRGLALIARLRGATYVDKTTGKPAKYTQQMIRALLYEDVTTDRVAVNAAMSTIFDPRNAGLPASQRRPVGRAWDEHQARRRELLGQSPVSGAAAKRTVGRPNP